MPQHPLFTRLGGALTLADLRLDDAPLPAGSDVYLFEPTLGAIEGALAELERAADKARAIQNDRDLREDAKARRSAELVVPAATAAREAFAFEVKRFRDYQDRMRRALLDRAKADATAEPVAFEARCARIAAELGPLPDGTVARIVTDAAAKGDRGPLDAVLASYTLRTRVSETVIAAAEASWAEAIDPDVAARQRQAGRLLAAAERATAVAANAGGRAVLQGLSCYPQAIAALLGTPEPVRMVGSGGGATPVVIAPAAVA